MSSRDVWRTASDQSGRLFLSNAHHRDESFVKIFGREVSGIVASYIPQDRGLQPGISNYFTDFIHSPDHNILTTEIVHIGADMDSTLEDSFRESKSRERNWTHFQIES